MLNNLKKLINAEAESDLQVDLMLEAVNDSIAAMFIDEDGDAEMSEEEINRVLDKIPAYDEDAELSKKLDRIAESYIPEDLSMEGMMSGKFRQMSNMQLRNKIKELEDEGNLIEAGKYRRELERRGIIEK